MSPVNTKSVWKTSARLSDGREIVYFDEAPGLGRAEVPDTRGLPPAPGGGAATAESALRWDALAGEWVVIAAARQDRTFLPPADQCPLDPSAPGRPTEIPAPSYDVVSFENRFPSLFGAGGALAGNSTDTNIDPLINPAIAMRRPATGRCEVVCFTSDHEASFASLPEKRVRTVVEAWADRTEALGALPGIEQVYCFENRGEEIGVTLHHPHGQIYAFPFVTPRTARMVTQAAAYAQSNGGNLFDDLVGAELEAGTRIVARNEHWIAFVPEAARWPYEVRIFPARRVPDIPALSEAQREAFGPLYLDLLRRFDRLFDTPAPYIAAWHQAPVTDEAARHQFGMHLQVLSVRRASGKLKYLAGTESGMGVWVNDIVPEAAAQRLREARGAGEAG
ncbi:MAG: galactose-1-phosphate uridylyltransferase [Streptosporangiaceae bacterium]|nr:galactose-1-phosphate uridylyltransferase [Streptosporangiaceae bacterium]MBV9855536.1 galactose-1-phosphate uridylyltransferase [Streptosporangiaceae bacterium]